MISSSISIGSLNKHRLVEMLLTAVIIINYKVPRHTKNVPYVTKNVAREQLKHLVNVNSLDII